VLGEKEALEGFEVSLFRRVIVSCQQHNVQSSIRINVINVPKITKLFFFIFFPPFLYLQFHLTYSYRIAYILPIRRDKRNVDIPTLSETL
jgi:hypothetical protein